MAEVSILIPNYRTCELTKLCLRLLRKFTDPKLAKFIVIDNDSQDESLTYLKTLPWITLLERAKVLGEPVHIAHSNALDLALADVDTPFVLSIHTDTLVKREDWLVFLLNQIKANDHLAGVGSWKLEQKSFLARTFKQMERGLQKWQLKFATQKQHNLEGHGENHFYLRSHCALYRTAVLRQHNLRFNMGDGVAGKVLHKSLVDQGYQMQFLPSEVLLVYLDHINHATMILNPELGASERTIAAGRKRLQQRLRSVDVEAILKDLSLDC